MKDKLVNTSKGDSKFDGKLSRLERDIAQLEGQPDAAFSNDLNVDKVAEMVWKVRNDLMIESDSPYHKPVISVYMQRDFWEWCMVQINGRVSSVACEFQSSYAHGSQQTVLGANIYVVEESKHPSFKIFGELQGKLRLVCGDK